MLCKLSSCNRINLFLIPGFKHICLLTGLPRRTLAYGNSRFCILENIQNRSMSTICKLSVTSQTSFRVYGQISNITIQPLTRTVGVINLSQFLPVTLTVLSWQLNFQSSIKLVIFGSGQIQSMDNFLVRRDGKNCAIPSLHRDSFLVPPEAGIRIVTGCFVG